MPKPFQSYNLKEHSTDKEKKENPKRQTMIRNNLQHNFEEREKKETDRIRQ